MRAGTLRHRVIFQRSTATQNAVGELVENWAELDAVYASVSPMDGREMYRDGVVATQPVQMICRRGSEIGSLDAGDRVLVPVGFTATTSAVTATSTSLKVSSAAEFPPAATGTAPSYRCRVQDELVTVTAGHGSTTWTITRSTDGSTATTHAAASHVVYMEPLDIESVADLDGRKKQLEIMAVRSG